MKKNIFVSVLMVAWFFMMTACFAAEAQNENATDRTLAALESPKSAVAAEVKKADEDAFKEDDFFVNETKSAPVAAVSDVAKKESEVSPVKAEVILPKASVSKASSGIILEKKETEASPRKGTPSALNPAELQRRWKALFSKEVASDSIAYTVKPGDSLYVLAQKNHTTVDFIKKINDLKGDSIYPKMKLKIHTAPFSIQIDKSRNSMILYSNDEAVKKYSVATGKKNCTPVGEFKITDKLVHPTWFKTGAILPPGSPENALGTRWMGFDKPGYGIHGTIEPKSIGTQASEGCIRMLNEEVEELYSVVPVGTKVTIQD